MLPVVYGQGENGVRAILYNDGNLVLDFNQAVGADSGSYNFYIKNTKFASSSNQNCDLTDGKVMIKVAGMHYDENGNKTGDMCNTGTLEVLISGINDSSFSDLIGMTIGNSSLSKPISLVVNDGSTVDSQPFSDETKVNTLSQTFGGSDVDITKDAALAGRGSKMALNAETSTLDTANLTDPDGLFRLIGWTAAKDGDSLVLDLNEHTVEDIIYAYAGETLSGKGDITAMTLYGCYEKSAGLQTTTYPVVYGQGANGVRTILYDDGQLMIDLNDVEASELQGRTDLYTVTVSNTASGSIVLEHQATTQGKLYVDLYGKDNLGKGDMCLAGTMTVGLKSEDASTAFEDAVTLTIVSMKTPMKFKIYDGSTTKTESGLFKTQSEVNTLTQKYVGPDTLTDIVGTTVVPERGGDLKLTDSKDTLDTYDGDSGKVKNLVDPDAIFELIGWTAKADSTSLTLDLEEHTIEEIIYAYADAMWSDDTWAEQGDGSKQTSTMTLYGCYGEKTFEINLYDTTTSKFILTSLSPTETLATVDTNIEAYVNQEVDANGYAILRIQQTAGNHVSNVYTFTQTDGGTSTTPATLKLGDNEGCCTIQYLASGVYKISSVKKDLYITVGVAENEKAPLSYNLSVDYVKNSTAGTARVSLDLYDASVSASGDTLKIDGTYYRNTGDGIRTYGQLSTINSSITTVKAYVDLQLDNEVIGGAQKDQTDTTSSVDANDYKAPENFAQGYMKLESADASAYDLEITLPKVGEKQAFFYAAQAVWTYGQGDTDKIETPWAIAENVSS